ncbi:MAG: hypothetical protein CSB44_06370 [Gammaproteobacteria bacterium]|nr:MAG: hypothetical protein CSB44_06370 [Gammaproteobacteria bacterium]
MTGITALRGAAASEQAGVTGLCRSLAAVGLVTALAGCGWVDSGGAQSADEVPATGAPIDDAPSNGPVPLQEKSNTAVTYHLPGAASEGARIVIQEEPADQGAIAGCMGANGFEDPWVADSLATACADPLDCALGFQTELVDSEADTEAVRFDISVPALIAPIGVRHRIEVIGSDGRVLSRNEPIFCLAAVNESPSVAADSYQLVDGQMISRSADEGFLANDSDDEDVRNQELSIVEGSVSLQPPGDGLVVNADGSFEYRPAPLAGSAARVDTVQFEVSDGYNDPVSSVAEFEVTPVNRRPALVVVLSVYEAVEGVPIEIDLTELVEDPEGQPLVFTLVDDDGLDGVELDSSGALEITFGLGESGFHALAFEASDGELALGFELEFSVEMALPGIFNEPPVYDEEESVVFSQEVELGERIRPLVPVFVDPDGDLLTYSIIGGELPPGVLIDPTSGVVSGRPLVAGMVRDLRIEASDGDLTAESVSFDITVE